MSCEQTRQLMAVWDPAGPDLPDRVALHLDTCPACRAALDLRFAPAGTVLERPGRRWTPVVAAALAVLAVGLGAVYSPESPAEEAPQAAEAPTH